MKIEANDILNIWALALVLTIALHFYYAWSAVALDHALFNDWR